MMGANELLFITISHSVSFVGKTWWMLMLAFRLLVLLLVGVTLFSDEQERFICNTIQPGCSNVCFDAFAPVSVFRLWIFHLILLYVPHVLFATYVTHKVLPYPSSGVFSSRELSLHKAPLHDLLREWQVPRFYRAYLLVVILRILLEVVFGAGQFYLFGLRFLCDEAPCTSGVECYVSRPTEKTLILNFMLGVASWSILLNLVDLMSSMEAMVRWRRKREMFMEAMMKGEPHTETTMTDDRKLSLCGGSKNRLKDDKHATAVAPNGEPLNAKVNGGTIIQTGESTNDKKPEIQDVKAEMSRLHTPFVLQSHLRPPLSPRPDRGLPPIPGMPTPKNWASILQLGQT